jgi:hypothetical protein
VSNIWENRALLYQKEEVQSFVLDMKDTPTPYHFTFSYLPMGRGMDNIMGEIKRFI